MQFNKTGRLVVIFLGVGLIGFLAAERLNFLRTDTIAAAACTAALVQDRPDASDLIDRSRTAILDAAEISDLPPEMLAAIILGHQRPLTRYRAFTDCAGSAFGADLSLGLAQVRISTALKADGLNPETVSPREFKAYRSALFDPSRNIRYAAKELRQIIELQSRFPGLVAEELIHEPATMTLLMSEYRAGRQEADLGETKISANALWDIRHMLEPGVYIFGRRAEDVASVRSDVLAYLDERYCDGAIFNDTACARWRQTSASLDHEEGSAARN